MPVESTDWTTLGLQLGGAIVVCGMFLSYLVKKSKADDESRAQFLAHLQAKDLQAESTADRHLKYLRDRDAQSKEIALNGHSVLREIIDEFQKLRDEVRDRS